MDRKVLSFIALAVSMIYGVLFAVIDNPGDGYAAIGGVIVALAWISVGVFGRDDDGGRNRNRDRGAS